MKYLIITALLFAGCAPVAKEEHRIVCDNFTSPWSWYYWQEDGIYTWNIDGVFYKRAQIEGEICHRETRKSEL